MLFTLFFCYFKVTHSPTPLTPKRKKMKKRPKVALIYDFDGTLAPGNMQEFGYMKAIGANKDEFWRQNDTLSEQNDASGILCYMFLMLREAHKQNIALSRDMFRKFGQDVKLYEGVRDWFDIITAYGNSIGLDISHFINSSGLKEMIEGTTIASKFEAIYASSYLYNKDGTPIWPAVAVDYTTKTQFIFKINKGIKEISDTKRINEYMPPDERPIPFSHMIYLGDGTTDVPCMKVVKDHGGHSIAVYKTGDERAKQTAVKLINEQRVNFACPANYREGKMLHKLVRRILDKIKADYEFDRLERLNKRRYSPK